MKVSIKGVGTNKEIDQWIQNEAETFLTYMAKQYQLKIPEIKINVFNPYEIFNQTVTKLLQIERLPYWVVGYYFQDEIYITSPNDPGPYHSSGDILFSLKHELTHLCMKVNRKNISLYIKWVEEGVAEYIAKGNQNVIPKSIRDLINAQQIPSLSKLEDNFVKVGGYHFSPTIFSFLDSIHKLGKFISLYLESCNKNELFQKLGMTEQDLEMNWKFYIKEKYSNER